MASDKKSIESGLNTFFTLTFGDAFKRCYLAEDVSDYQLSTVDLPTQESNSIELGELPVIVELSNGHRFEIAASEWVTITPL